MASPRLSPSGSPMINRRTGRSPVQSLMAAPPDPATHLVSTHLSDRPVTRQKSVILCTPLFSMSQVRFDFTGECWWYNLLLLTGGNELSVSGGGKCDRPRDTSHCTNCGNFHSSFSFKCTLCWSKSCKMWTARLEILWHFVCGKTYNYVYSSYVLLVSVFLLYISFRWCLILPCIPVFSLMLRILSQEITNLHFSSVMNWNW